MYFNVSRNTYSSFIYVSVFFSDISLKFSSEQCISLLFMVTLTEKNTCICIYKL